MKKSRNDNHIFLIVVGLMLLTVIVGAAMYIYSLEVDKKNSEIINNATMDINDFKQDYLPAQIKESADKDTKYIVDVDSLNTSFDVITDISQIEQTMVTFEYFDGDKSIHKSISPVNETHIKDKYSCDNNITIDRIIIYVTFNQAQFNKTLTKEIKFNPIKMTYNVRDNPNYIPPKPSPSPSEPSPSSSSSDVKTITTSSTDYLFWDAWALIQNLYVGPYVMSVSTSQAGKITRDYAESKIENNWYLIPGKTVKFRETPDKYEFISIS